MHNTTGLRRCTAQNVRGDFCDRPSLPDAPYPVCSSHAVRLFRFMADALDSADAAARLAVGFEELDEARAQRFRSERREVVEGVVYYLMIDGLVKIGYTANLARRLVGYPPSAQVLATEPGTLALETDRHREFRDYLTAGREWFTPGPKLRSHIEGLADFRAA